MSEVSNASSPTSVSAPAPTEDAIEPVITDDIANFSASSSAASSTTSAATNTATILAEAATVVTPPAKTKPLSVCKFTISSIYHGPENDDNFSVLLIPSQHGLYDLIDAVFKHSLTKLTEGWTIDSRMWTVDFDNTKSTNNSTSTTSTATSASVKKKAKFVSLIEESMLEFYDATPLVCDREQRRIFSDLETSDVFPFEKNSKGYFEFDHRPVKFRFTLAEVRVADLEVDSRDKNAIEQYPKCQPIESAITITAVGEAEFVTPEEQRIIKQLSAAYTSFYQNLNGWQLERRTRRYKPAKPSAPEWSNAEIEMMGLFMNSGWKFAKSWKCGLMYAFPHRTKSSAQGKWYALQKESYRIESAGRTLSPNQKVIRAKKLCLELMEEMIEQGAPQPIRKPKDRTYEVIMAEEMSDCDPVRFDPRTAHGYLPKRLRSRW